MDTQVTANKINTPVRPLRILVPLIKAALRKSAEEIGDLLAEARPQFSTVAEFLSWTHKNFGFRQTQSMEYLSLGRTRENDFAAANQRKSFESLADFQRRELGRNRPTTGRVNRELQRRWNDIAERARREAERLREEDLTRRQERDAQRVLALRLIDIGYKVLAKELHPDKGGDRSAMQRLGIVRDRLKASA